MKKRNNFVAATSIGPAANIIFNIIIAIISICCIYPMIFVFMISISSESAIGIHGFKLIPSTFSGAGYSAVLQIGGAQLLQSYLVSICVTVVGTGLGIIIMSLFAYAISRQDFKYRKFFTWVALVPMFFSGGFVPTYLINTQVLKFNNHFWALIIPGLASTMYILILRTYFKNSIPPGLVEAARIDGADEFKIYYKIVMPLAKPVIATLSLLMAIGYWGDWYTPFLYITKNSLTPLQALLYSMQQNIQFIANNAALAQNPTLAVLAKNMPTQTTQMAIVVLATIPIACAYPFFQRYIISGMTVGGIKE